jgi:PAS domain S-box-containing protein
MKKKHDKPDAKKTLRQRAEEAYAGRPESRRGIPLKYKDVESLVHGLRVCQIERQIQNDELRRAEADWQNTFDSITDLTFLLDNEHRITKANKIFLDAFKLKPEDVIGKKCYELLHKSVAPLPDCPFCKTLIDKKHHTERIDDPCIGIPLLMTTSPIFNNRNELIGSVHFAKDISELKVAEKALKESEEKFRALFNDSRDGMLLADPDTGKFHMWNKAICEMLGYTREELCRISVKDIHPEEDLEFIMDIFQRQALGEFKLAEGLPVKKKDGAIFYADINSSPIILSGKKYLLGSFRDITQRREIEERLKAVTGSYQAVFESANDAIIIRDINTYEVVDANDKACRMFCYTKAGIIGLPFEALGAGSQQYPHEKLRSFYDKAAGGEQQLFEWPAKDKLGREFWVEINMKRAIIGGQYRLLSISRDVTERRQVLEQKDNFMNMVSHELRTPLGAIKESISLVLEGGTGTVGGEQKEILAIAKRNVDRLTRLINQVLYLQKIDAGRMELRLEENDMNETIREVHRVMIALAAEKGLEIILELDDSLPRARFDKDKIIQVLANLVSNAINFTAKGAIMVTSSKGKNFIQVSVRDTGPGIKEEDMPKLFRRFSQLERRPGGAGLGLSVCKEMIDLHGGRIWAESPPSAQVPELVGLPAAGKAGEYGKGTAFCFILPVKERRI